LHYAITDSKLEERNQIVEFLRYKLLESHFGYLTLLQATAQKKPGILQEIRDGGADQGDGIHLDKFMIMENCSMKLKFAYDKVMNSELGIQMIQNSKYSDEDIFFTNIEEALCLEMYSTFQSLNPANTLQEYQNATFIVNTRQYKLILSLAPMTALNFNIQFEAQLNKINDDSEYMEDLISVLTNIEEKKEEVINRILKLEKVINANYKGAELTSRIYTKNESSKISAIGFAFKSSGKQGKQDNITSFNLETDIATHSFQREYLKNDITTLINFQTELQRLLLNCRLNKEEIVKDITKGFNNPKAIIDEVTEIVELLYQDRPGYELFKNVTSNDGPEPPSLLMDKLSKKIESESRRMLQNHPYANTERETIHIIYCKNDRDIREGDMYYIGNRKEFKSTYGIMCYHPIVFFKNKKGDDEEVICQSCKKRYRLSNMDAAEYEDLLVVEYNKKPTEITDVKELYDKNLLNKLREDRREEQEIFSVDISDGSEYSDEDSEVDSLDDVDQLGDEDSYISEDGDPDPDYIPDPVDPVEDYRPSDEDRDPVKRGVLTAPPA